MNNKTICINGVLKVGDTVLSTPTGDYPCLVGVVSAINAVGSEEHDSETENQTDDVHVDFDNRYTENRQAEILEVFRDLYDDYTKSYDDINWEVIMAPGELIRLDVTEKGNPVFYNNILNKESAASLCAFIELYKVCCKPREDVAYSVVSEKREGKNVTTQTDCFLALHTAWESACESYSELREKFKYSTRKWKDTSDRSKGVFSCEAEDGDYFKVYILKHIKADAEPFSFPNE